MRGAMDDGIGRLKAIPLFSELPESTLQRIAQVTADAEIPSGQTLAQRDDPGSGMYAIEAGNVAVKLHGRSVELGPGDIFGELSLLVPGAKRSRGSERPHRCAAWRSAEPI